MREDHVNRFLEGGRKSRFSRRTCCVGGFELIGTTQTPPRGRLSSGDPFQSLWKFIYLLPRHSLSDSSPSFLPPSNDTTHALILGLRDRSCATRLIPIFISKKLLDTFFLVISGLGIYTTTQITWPFCSPWLKQTRGRIIMRTWVLRPTRNRRTLRSSSGS